MSLAVRRLAACLLLAAAGGCAAPGALSSGGRREIRVDAEGWSPIAGGDVLAARRRALAEAQKKAVEKAVGVTLRANTRVDDAVSVKQSIEANLGGTISRYEVTAEGEQGGFFKVSIRADVVSQPVEPESRTRAPSRLAVHIASQKVEGAVRGELAALDFELGDDAGADVAITGVVETRGLADPRLGGFFSYTAKVTLNAANLRTGKVSTVEAEASAVDVDDRAACDRALEKAGLESASALGQSLSGEAAPAAVPDPVLDVRARSALALAPPL